MYILTKDEMYEAEKFTKEKVGIKEEILMENAGQKMVDEILKVIDKNRKIGIFCGNNNNAGDGFVVARKLKILGFSVYIVFLGKYEKLKGAALLNYSICKNLNIDFLTYPEDVKDFSCFDVIIDAMFGIGFKGELKFPYNEVVEKINGLNSFVIALDIPTGVYADFNIPSKTTIKADLTLTVSFYKRSAFLYPAKLFYGKIVLVDANIVLDEKMKEFCSRVYLEEDFKKTFPKKEENTNKSKEGKVLLIGGSDNMPGSISLTAKACYNSGVGLCEVATTKEVKMSLASNILEVIFAGTDEEDGVLKDFDVSKKIDVVACGPGLSRNNITKEVVKKAILLDLPLVLDADALYFLDDELLGLIKNKKTPTVLTPHENEMARLCDVSCEEVFNNRFLISKKKAKEFMVYIVLKGPNTIITTKQGKQFVNITGGVGLSKGGSGDVLTGIIASFLARDKDVKTAICNAVYIHGKVCDFLISKNENENTITPSKLIDNLKFVF